MVTIRFKNKVVFLLFSLLSLTVSLLGQNIVERRADEHVKNFDYQKAIDIYLLLVEKNRENRSVKLKLADTYRRMKNLSEAKDWYSESVKLDSVEPKHYLHYGQVLQQTGNCQLAKVWYGHYSKKVPQDNRGQNLARACNYQEELMKKNASLYQVKQLWFNSENDDFSPAYYKNSLVFTSDRPATGLLRNYTYGESFGFLNLFKVEMELEESDFSNCDYTFKKPKLFEAPIRSQYHDATAVFSKDWQEIFFTRSNIEDSKAGEIPILEVYYSRKLRGDWIPPELLPFNGSSYSIVHPALSADGNYLYFASDMPGGFGGMDVYRAERVGNRWNEPVNLGNQINTEGNEIFPTIDESGRLFFSSDGHIGLGGLDIYSAEELQNGDWSYPENLGSPINNIADDFGIIFNNDGTCGFFSSNRLNGKGGDDIYSFEKRAVNLTVQVVDEVTNKTLVGAIVENLCDGESFNTNASGRVVYDDMELNKCCYFKATIDGYNEKEVEHCTDNLRSGATTNLRIMLRKQLKFSLTGTVFNSRTSLPMNDVTISLYNELNPTIPEQTLVTRADGRFEFELREGTCYAVAASQAGVTSKRQVGYCTKDIYENKTFSSKIIFGTLD